MLIFSSTAAFVQLIKLTVFFLTLGLPSAHGNGAEQLTSSPAHTAAIHGSERPHSNPRRNRR